MDLAKSGKLLRSLRTSKGMTQKQVADKLGVLPKTVSKWETGHGFPDISYISDLSDILEVSTETLLAGNLNLNQQSSGNVKNIKFYYCKHCQSFVQSIGKTSVICCGKQLSALIPQPVNNSHSLNVAEIENDFYITFNHEMTKEHHIAFIAFVATDRFLTVKLYPEQDSSVRFPKMYDRKIYFYCTKHGLFEYPPSLNKQNIQSKQNKQNNTKLSPSLTALLSAFSIAFTTETQNNSENKQLKENLQKALITNKEYQEIKNYISFNTKENDISKYVNTYLAPTPVARKSFCTDCLKTAVLTGTTQYVILGCGYDVFSLENKNRNINTFEIDKPEMIADKLNRIKKSGLKIPDNTVFISADLTKNSIKNILLNNGFNKNKKTLFSCFGLFYYLTKEEISNLFKELSTFVATGSTVIFDFPDSHIFSSEISRVKNMLKMAEQSGEPMKTCFSYNELEKLLENNNFLIYEFLNPNDIQKRYFNGSQNITAFENIDFVQAVFKK